MTTTLLTGPGSFPNDGSSPWFTGPVATTTGNTAATITTTTLDAISDGSVAVVNATVRFFNNGEAGVNPLTDRALGTGNTAGDPVIDLQIINSSGLAMSGFSLSFDTEWWRGGSSTAASFGYLLYYSPTGAASSWTAITGAAQPSKTYAAVQDLDGNAAANRLSINTNFTFPSQIGNGSIFFLRWQDTNDPTNSPDANIAIDNVSFTGMLVPPPGKNLVYDRLHAAGGAPNGVLGISNSPYWLDGSTPSGFANGDSITFSQNGSAAISVPSDVIPGSTTVSNVTGTYTIGGAGKISGPLTKTDTGTLVLSSVNSFTSVTLSGGTLVAQASNALGAAPLTVSGTGGTLQAQADVAALGINGTGPLLKKGVGALVVTSIGTGTGGITIQAGKVQADSDAALGGNTQSITLDGGMLEFTNTAADVILNDATKTRTITVTANGGTISGTGTGAAGLILALADSIAGSGTLAKSGPSALRIAANQSTFTGNWIITGGTLEYGIGLTNGLGSGTVTVNAGGQLSGKGNAAPATTVIPNNVILNGGDLGTRTTDTVIFGGNVNVAATSTATLRSFTTPANSQGFAIGGVLSGAADLIVAGVNPQTNGLNKALSLTNTANTYNGAFRVAAAQILASEPASGSGNTLGTGSVVLSNSTLRIRDNGLGNNGLLAYGNNIIADTGNSTIDLDHAAAGTSTGNTVRFGRLAIGNQTLTVLGASSYQASFIGPVTLNGNATFDINTRMIVNGSINGAFGITKAGPGELTLNGGSAFTGAATISGGTLGGSGSVPGVLAVNAAATFAPGNNGPGTFATGGNVTLASGSTLLLEIAHGAGAAPVAGTDFDRVLVGTGAGATSTGSLTLGGGALSLTLGTGIKLNDIFFIVINDGTDAVSGTFNGLADDTIFTAGANQFQITYDANSTTGSLNGGNDIALVAVPEPASLLLALCGGASLFSFRRRRI